MINYLFILEKLSVRDPPTPPAGGEEWVGFPSCGRCGWVESMSGSEVVALRYQAIALVSKKKCWVILFYSSKQSAISSQLLAQALPLLARSEI
ncbi:MAG: hypothetical protein F6J93_06910 [Oscillatoria sp. SIO1A7]|nr:hypothetical protein [Oscillatoria sp. SIO1A7]